MRGFNSTFPRYAVVYVVVCTVVFTIGAFIETLWGSANLWAKEAGHVAVTTAQDLAHEVMRAPAVLDGETLKTWVNASVWTLLSLNLLSLFLYLSALTFPAIKKVYFKWQAFKRERQEMKRRRVQNLQSVGAPMAAATAGQAGADVTTLGGSAQAMPSDATNSEAEIAATAAAAMQLASGDIVSPANPLPGEAASQPELSTAEIQEVLDIAASPSSEVTEVISPQAATSPAETPVEEVYEAPPTVEEVYEKPPVVETVVEATTEAAAPSVETAAPPAVESVATPAVETTTSAETTVVLDVKTLEESSPIPEQEASLPVTQESGETGAMVSQDEAATALAAIEKNIEDAFEAAPSEELSIFDATALDKILLEEDKP